MTESIMNFDLPETRGSIIKVIGVGGGGGNAVNHMHEQGIKDVEFMICNTDSQALANSPVELKVQLGASLTEGRGAGNKPEMGREAAIENIEDVKEVLENNTKMIFITAGMGGGTGTGAAPVIAEAAREMGLLTVAIVTIPFRNEGARRINQALEGIRSLEGNVDSLLVINNEKIREMYGDFKISEAFAKADNVLATAAKGIAEIITVHGYINVDFADVETVMRNSGVSLMGSALATGENRAIRAVEEALNSPLLNNNDITGAKNILLNITSGAGEYEVTMDEVGQITDYVQKRSGHAADLIWGNGIDETLNDEICVTIIATGFSTSSIPEMLARQKNEKTYVPLVDSDVASSTPTQQDQPRQSAPQSYTLDDEPESEDDNIYSSSDDDFGYEEEADSRTIEFEIKTPEPDEFESLYGKRKVDSWPLTKETTEKPVSVQVDFHELADESIDEIENVPAFKRKSFKLKDNTKTTTEEDISRFSLREDKDKKTIIHRENPYIHDNPD
ncbi:MAG: cell division protein FtsZ [Bacteroidota bacterium]|nr:cell division protein FtsZ [Bacteroidota bacterium]